MSGPIDDRDAGRADLRLGRAVDVREGRAADIGGFHVVRVLPTKGRRTVAAWCFVDLMIPPDAHEPDPLEIGPHPHIGLATVTWLFQGEALHGDSLGTEQVIRPGQLNLMTAGHGIAHSELSTPVGVQGVQMWIAQPEETRHGDSSFEHHPDLPRVELGVADVTVFMGQLAGAVSPARADTALVGLDIEARPGAFDLAVRPTFEYGVVPLDGPVVVDGAVVEPGWLGLVEAGPDALRLEAGASGARFLVLGGEPLGEPVQMWWNFVGRSRDELTRAWQAWRDHDTDRFGPVPSRLERIEAPIPPWVRGEA
jgi:quercetin 2,3-dioxygenase